MKQIEIAEARISGGHNKSYVKLLSVGNRKGVITAKVELDMQTRSGVQRQEVTVQDGDNLEMTTNRAVYHDCRIGEIRIAKGSEFMELRVPGGEHFLKPGEAFGDLDALAVQREMISRTIKEHLTKELRLAPQGIKVLSLFFIDSVERYRQYDAEGNQIKGDYAKIFEEEYRRLAKHPDYQSLFKEVDLHTAAEEVHNGYFSIDKKKLGSKTVEVFKDRRSNDNFLLGPKVHDRWRFELTIQIGYGGGLAGFVHHSSLREAGPEVEANDRGVFDLLFHMFDPFFSSWLTDSLNTSTRASCITRDLRARPGERVRDTAPSSSGVSVLMITMG